jgi:hypothetical protein
MTVTLDEFTKDFTPEERAQVADRTAAFIEQELTPPTEPPRTTSARAE